MSTGTPHIRERTAALTEGTLAEAPRPAERDARVGRRDVLERRGEAPRGRLRERDAREEVERVREQRRLVMHEQLVELLQRYQRRRAREREDARERWGRKEG